MCELIFYAILFIYLLVVVIIAERISEFIDAFLFRKKLDKMIDDYVGIEKKSYGLKVRCSVCTNKKRHEENFCKVCRENRLKSWQYLIVQPRKKNDL